MIFRTTRLKSAVERAHRCHATHLGSRIIAEPLPDVTVWRGPVDVFQLAGQPQSDRCYAWAEKRGFRSVCFTRLKTAAVKSAQTAVRAVLARRLLAPKLPSY